MTDDGMILDKQMIKTLSEAVRTTMNRVAPWEDLKKAAQMLGKMRRDSAPPPEVSHENIKTLYDVGRTAMDETSPGYEDFEKLEKAHQILKHLRATEKQMVLDATERKACEARVRSMFAKNYPNLTGADLEKQIEKTVITELAAEKCSLGQLGIKIVPNADGFSLFNKAGEEVSCRVSVADALKAQKALVSKETRKMLNSRYDDLKSGKVQPLDGEEVFARLKAKANA